MPNFPAETNTIIHAFGDAFPELFTYPRRFDDLAVLQERVTTWAEQYPEDVHIVRCDDAMFASSILVLIDHRSKKEYFGTSVVYIPQCQGEPANFFLYPGDRRALLQALNKLDPRGLQK